ncbi:questin oxidase family protein [Aspergillus glaucus CBS 516.65]|uniref:Oxidoreductase AflY n=1 Tax=Aspergillus glaucus CBS 516.65 TaxID=1160497 RepID=A0A1L9VWT9_ASPGL|nr:hypothetical protein ASPGLDRAFT_71432 [Aspergillus glaucus CBS 516.65]OJJ88366.1 hypothetical protein ASPGLDRAFT_71432 [Aspergillus glaucus CBS 516.65]
MTKITSDLLTVNHHLYHTRWKSTFHNHIVHHLLALWALGASPAEIQDMWDYNTPYQSSIERDLVPGIKGLDLNDPVTFDKCLGNDDCYAVFLGFFENEVAEKGWQNIVKEYVLKGDERADDILCRLFSDLVHPMIHLGSVIEFQQPSLIAEALAGACVHDNWPKRFLLPTEKYVRSQGIVSSMSLLHVLNSLRGDPEIASGVKATDPFNKIPDGFLQRITDEQLAPYLGLFQVKPTAEDLQAKMADMMQTVVYMRESIDFVLLHCATLCVFYPAILAQDWISDLEKSRLLKATARVGAVMYAGCGSPKLDANRIREDEGHAAKLVRAFYSLEQLPEPPVDFPIRKRDILTIAHMTMDSIEGALEADGPKVAEQIAEAVLQRIGRGGKMVVDNMKRWVFYGGLEGAWDNRPDLKTS